MSAQTSILSDTAPGDAKACDLPADAAEAFARPLIERQLLRLERLTEIGLGIAEAVGRQAAGALAEGEAPVTQGDVVATFARVSRAVRLTVALQTRLIAALRGLDEDRAKAEDVETTRRYWHEEARKGQIAQIVERRLRAEHEGEPDNEVEALADRLTDEVSDRLDYALYGDLLARPVRAVVAEACRDFGLKPDWPGLAEEGWAIRDAVTDPAAVTLSARMGAIVRGPPSREDAAEPDKPPPSPRKTSPWGSAAEEKRVLAKCNQVLAAAWDDDS